MSNADTIPLHRLLNQRETTAMLGEFARLMPGVDLVLMDADGQSFVSLSARLPEERAAWLEHARPDRPCLLDGWRIVPLRNGEALLGVLAAHGELDTPPVEQALHCLERSLSLLLAEALAKRTIARETLDRYREINLLYSISEALGGRLDPQEISQLVLREASRIIRADMGAVLLTATDTPAVREVCGYFGPGELVSGLCQGTDELIERVCASGQPAIVAEPLARCSTLLCAPLKTQERIVGAILLGRQAPGEVFTAGDEKLLMAIVSQAASAVENARLFDSVRRQRDEIAGMKSYMDSIFASIASGVITTDAGQRIMSMNQAAERILNVCAEEAVGRPCLEGLPGLGQAIMPLVNAVQRQGEPVREYVLEADLPRRGPVVLRLHISPLKESQLATMGIAVVVDDLTEHRQLEEQVRRVRETFERYVAPNVVERLLSDPTSVWLGGVLREITTLYADIRDFTAYGEKIAPELQIEVLNRHLTVAAEAVLMEEGTLDKFIGDAAMALFNAPLPQPDHALRAVRAAMRMQQAIAELHSHLPEDEQLSFGIGIATGPAVVGNVGSTRIQNYTAVGDSVNLAARLQAYARPGQILLSATAYQHVRDYIVARELGYIQVKGHSRPDQVFEALGLRSSAP